MKKKNKIWMMLGIVVLLTMGTTLAVWHQRVEQTNHLVADTIKAQVVENYTTSQPEDTVKKEVSFENAGSTDVFVRVAYIETWEKKDTNGKVMLLSNKLNDADVANKNWTTSFSSEWQDGGDGWFYYKYVLPAGECTEKILDSVTFPDYEQEDYLDYRGADYSLYFKVEMLQASTGEATLNKDTVNKEASQVVFGKSATVDFNTNTVVWQ